MRVNRMTTTVSATSSITINAPASKVWDAITTPAMIKQWFFGVDTETDWKEGSPIVHRGEWQGKPYEDKGTILTVEPHKRLVHSHWSPMSGLPDSPENYERITYTLTERDGKTELKLSETNLPSEDAKTLSLQIWERVLESLKQLVEK
jgi:uncharacterized protein YndB with AHSA1/START domain